MRDFDQEQREEQARRAEEFANTTFKFRGQTFYANPNAGFHQTKMLAMADMQGAASLQMFEDSVLNLIVDRDGAHDRFRAIVAGENQGEEWFPVTTQNLVELHNWLIGEVSNRPPTQPAASSNGSAGTGTQSTGSSSSEPAAASRA